MSEYIRQKVMFGMTKIRDTGRWQILLRSWAGTPAARQPPGVPESSEAMVIQHQCPIGDGLNYSIETTVKRDVPPTGCDWCNTPLPKEVKFILRMCEIHEKL